MKNVLYLTLSSFFFFFLIHSASSQEIKEFEKDTAIFIQQFEEFTGVNITEEQEDSLESFILKWNAGYFSDEVKERFIDVCNLMLDKKARRDPHFMKYFDMVMLFHQTEQAKEHYDNWEKGLIYIFENKKYPLNIVNKYFNNIKSLLQDSILFSNYSTSWHVSSNNYEIIVEDKLQIKFDKTDLTCKIKNDSIDIFETEGIFYPITNDWVGKKGIVTWERAGYPADSVKAELSNYKINMSKSGYKADSVYFTNKIYFDEPILGKFNDQVVHIMSPEKAIYPEFISYQSRFEIENIFKDIDYEGGLNMKGANLLGFGDRNQEAVITINKNDTSILTAKAKTFMFKKDRAVSNNAQINISFGTDSIYHPGILFSYLSKKREITLSPSDRIVSKSPYFDSYHNITMNFDRLLWQIDQDKIYLTKRRGSAIGNAVYTSSNFFNILEFERIMMRDSFHPLLAIRNYSNKIGSETFTGEKFARFLKYDTYQIKQMLMFLSVDGFIFYDSDEDEAIIKQKLYDFIDARFGKIDYDVIKFESVTEDLIHNGILDLNNYDLEINGVPEIQLSDYQNVKIYPKGNKIIMTKNRDFSFGGTIAAGLFTFYGQEFYFSYDTFKINLYNIDSLRIKVQTEEYDMYNNPVLAHIKNTVEIITGDLLIDNPNNKSGLQDFPQYPIFNSIENSYVYYANIHNGVYKRENFYFELDPFTIDSLDNFSVEGLRFDGKFYSADIFPPFRDKLYMQPDYSLGFIRSTPPDGYPLYQGKGTYYDLIDLSNRGLRGSGTLEYLTTKAVTDDIIFFPDSTKIHATDFTMDERDSGIEFPGVKSNDIEIKWFPYDDIMYASQTKEPFNLYNNNSRLFGSLIIQPVGLSGKGRMDLEKAELKSNLFNFESNSFNSDTTSFRLKSINKKDFNFTTENLKGEIDFGTQQGNFNSNESFTIAEFPKNLYVSYLDKFNWSIAKDEIAIESNPQIDTSASEHIKELARLKDNDLPGALFMSTHRGQDSLRFASTKAIYKLKDSTLNATEVEYIRVADALVFPDKNNVTIKNLAEIQTLQNSEIIADRLNRYHKIYNAKINIRGRYKYLGTGDYDYVDENKEVQTIHFTQIDVDTSRQTIAESKLTMDDNFTLSPVYHFQGKAKLFARDKYLTFDGGVKIDYDCPRKGTYFAAFKTEINPDSIYIPITENQKSYNGHGLFAASFITKDSSHIYSRFLERRRDPNDVALVRATGFLHYDKNANKYIISEESKFLNKDTTGTLISLQRDFCLQHGEGKVDLGIDLGQVKFSPAGSVNHLLDENEIKTEIVFPMDFFFSEAALDTLIQDLRSIQSLGAMSINSGFFEKNMTELYGKTDYNEFKNQIMLYADESELPSSTKHTMLLGNLKLKWYTENGSYLNYGKIGIATINNKPINRYVDGYFQLLKRRSGDLMKFYIELPNNHYYYFTYSRGVMQTLSNNEDFVNAIQNIKNKARKLKTPRGETPYRYIIATEQNRAQFLRSMRLFEEAQAAKEEELKQLEEERRQQEENEKLIEEKLQEHENIQDSIPIQSEQEVKSEEGI